MATQIEKNTAKVMLDRLHGQLDDLYYKQESKKVWDDYRKYCRGGRIGRKGKLKMKGGGIMEWFNNTFGSGYSSAKVGNIPEPEFQDCRFDFSELPNSNLSRNMRGVRQNQYDVWEDDTRFPKDNTWVNSKTSVQEPASTWGTPKSPGATTSASTGSIAKPTITDKFYGQNIDSINNIGINNIKNNVPGRINSLADMGTSYNSGDYERNPGSYSFGQNAKAWLGSGKVQNAIGGIGSAVNAGLGLAPAIWNLMQGQKPAERLDYSQYRNRRSDQALGLMADRKYDPSQEIASATARSNAFRQTARNIPQSSGALMSQMGGAQARYQGDVSNALRNASNINQQYKGQYAEMLNQVGEQDARMRLGLKDINLRNEAMQKGYTAAGLTGLQQYGLTREQMKNQKGMDEMRMKALNQMSPWQYDELGNLSFNNQKKKFGGKFRKQPSLWKKVKK